MDVFDLSASVVYSFNYFFNLFEFHFYFATNYCSLLLISITVNDQKLLGANLSFQSKSGINFSGWVGYLVIYGISV